MTVIKVWSAFAEEACGRELKNKPEKNRPPECKKTHTFGTNLKCSGPTESKPEATNADLLSETPLSGLITRLALIILKGVT